MTHLILLDLHSHFFTDSMFMHIVALFYDEKCDKLFVQQVVEKNPFWEQTWFIFSKKNVHKTFQFWHEWKIHTYYAFFLIQTQRKGVYTLKYPKGYQHGSSTHVTWGDNSKVSTIIHTWHVAPVVTPTPPVWWGSWSYFHIHWGMLRSWNLARSEDGFESWK